MFNLFEFKLLIVQASPAKSINGFFMVTRFQTTKIARALARVVRDSTNVMWALVSIKKNYKQKNQISKNIG